MSMDTGGKRHCYAEANLDLIETSGGKLESMILALQLLHSLAMVNIQRQSSID